MLSSFEVDQVSYKHQTKGCVSFLRALHHAKGRISMCAACTESETNYCDFEGMVAISTRFSTKLKQSRTAVGKDT